VGEKLSKVGAHPLVEQLNSKKEILLAVVGLVICIHGNYLRNIVICCQVIMPFFFQRIRDSAVSMYGDVQTAREKMKADAPEPEDTSAEKTEAKKDDKATAQKEHLDVAKKVLKTLDAERMCKAATDILLAIMACIIVLHGGLAQAVVVTYNLVVRTSSRLSSLLSFPGFEDVDAWTKSMISLALWVVLFPAALVMGPLVPVVNAASFGALLALEFGARQMKNLGKVEDAEAFVASTKGLAALAGLTAVGTFWQLWACAAGSSVYWPFQLLYLPALVVEGILGLL